MKKFSNKWINVIFLSLTVIVLNTGGFFHHHAKETNEKDCRACLFYSSLSSVNIESSALPENLFVVHYLILSTNNLKFNTYTATSFLSRAPPVS